MLNAVSLVLLNRVLLSLAKAGGAFEIPLKKGAAPPRAPIVRKSIITLYHWLVSILVRLSNFLLLSI